VAQVLFSDTRTAWIWALVRLYLGWQWFEASLHKVTSAGWLTGSSIEGFWKGAVAIPAEGSAPIHYGWYRGFLQFLIDTHSGAWFGPLVAFGEMVIGIGLILGAFTGIAAFFGALMNFNFMLAGTASSNPVLFILAVFLMMAWKTAGWWGADRWLLPMVGTPWQPHRLLREEEEQHERTGVPH